VPTAPSFCRVPALDVVVTLVSLALGCGGEAPTRVPAMVDPGRASASTSAPKREAAMPSPTDAFSCRGAIDSCQWEGCRDGLVCAGPANYACGEPAPASAPCAVGSCEASEGVAGVRVCLPEGCCGPTQPVGEAIACTNGQRAAVEISRDGAATRWTTCIDDASGNQLLTFGATDGTLMLFARFDVGPDRIGYPEPIEAVVRLPLDKLDGAFVHLADAVFTLNQHGQRRIESASAVVFAREGGVPVEGTLSMGHVTPSVGRVDGLELRGVELASCGRANFDCSFAVHVDDKPVLLHGTTRNGALVEGFIASRGPDGVDVFRARRLASAPSNQQQIDMAQFERLRPLDVGAGPTRVRITIESE